MKKKWVVLIIILIIILVSRMFYVKYNINYISSTGMVTLKCENDGTKKYIDTCNDIDNYKDFKYSEDKYNKYVDSIDISGTSINYIDDLSKYPNLKSITIDEGNNITEIPDLSEVGENLEYLEFDYSQSISEVHKEKPFAIRTISNLETIPVDLLQNGFEIRLNICGIEKITSKSKEIIQEYPNIIDVPSAGAMNYNDEVQCINDYYKLAGIY